MMNNRKKTVFVLGAGASKTAGVPLMADFLDTAHDIRRLNRHSGFEEDYDAVFEGIEALQGVYAKSFLDLRNLEAVFTAFEMGNLLGMLGNLDADKRVKLAHHMSRLILSVVEQTTIFGWGQTPIKPPEPYEQFVERLKQLTEMRHDISILTFNYDLSLDYALALYDSNPNPHVKLEVEVFSLHGSIGWRDCTKVDCDHVSKLPWRQMISNPNSYWKPLQVGPPDRTQQPKHSVLKVLDNPAMSSDKCYCSATLVNAPMIVPPTWNKSRHYFNVIEEQWKGAAKALSEAENIFVCGFSLPPTDEFFRYLYAISTTKAPWLRRFWVFNPDASLEARFRDLIGKGIESRFQYHATIFGTAFEAICRELGKEP